MNAKLKAIPACLAAGLALLLAGRPSGAQDDRSWSFMVTLADPEENAKKKSATIQVDVSGFELVAPAAAGEEPRQGQAHLHYKVDDGPVIATTEKTMSFHGLAPGKHTIKVQLAGNDHNPIGPEDVVTVNIP